MERSEERRENRSVDEAQKRAQVEGNEEVPVVSRGQECRVEPEASDTKDEEEEEGSSPLITACRTGMTEVVQRLLRAGADATLCSCSRKTALHVSPPELRGKVLGWMSRPHLPPQARLLQAAWQGDLHSLQRLLAQADRVDVNVANSDGVTAVMLAVRDVDLFEGMVALLPWEHRPVEVDKELLGLSADLRIRDHSGCCAPRYAANINNSLKEEIIKMMVEALSHTDAASTSLLALDKYSGQDLDSEFGDSDVELDRESLYPDRSTAASPTQTPAHQSGFLLYSHTGEVLESPGYPPPSDHRKGLSHDKGIPFYFQNAMETLRDIRQAYQDAGRGSSRGGLSLPSLGDSSRRWSHMDPAPSPGLLSTRTSCLPVPPQNRQRTRSVVAASPSSLALLSVAEPSQLSQSAPSIMEPLLCSNIVMQARAHIQTRLVFQDTVNEQKGPLLALHPRTPKLLAPLDSRPREIAALPALKHRVPLKPISRSPLCSRTRLRRERLSWGSPRTGLLTTKGGSEESGSSSHSSFDLEDEDEEDGRDVCGKASRERHMKLVGERLAQRSNDASPTEADLVGETRQHLKVLSKISHIPPIHRSARDLDGKPINRTNSHCEGQATNDSFIKYQYAQQGDTVNDELSIRSKSKEERNHVGCTPEHDTDISHGITFHLNNDHGDDIAYFEGTYRNNLQHMKQTRKTMRDSCCEETQVDDPIPCKEDVKIPTVTTEETIQLFTPAGNLPQSDMDPKGDERMLKALKPVLNKDRRTSMNCELRADIQTTQQSFNVLAHKNRSVLNRNKSKSNLKHSTQVKDKTRNGPEQIISGETVTKVKSKLKSVKGAHCHTGTPSPRKKLSDQGKRANPDKVNRAQQHAPTREPKSIRQFKRPGIAGTPRSKSTVDFVTYKDMFQQIQSRDEGPAIYEMS